MTIIGKNMSIKNKKIKEQIVKVYMLKKKNN